MKREMLRLCSLQGFMFRVLLKSAVYLVEFYWALNGFPPWMLQGRSVMTGSNTVMVVRLSPSFIRRFVESLFLPWSFICLQFHFLLGREFNLTEIGTASWFVLYM